ncbi:MAG: hypothetical protein V2A61_00840, partial [Calditrichota bacterium]
MLLHWWISWILPALVINGINFTPAKSAERGKTLFYHGYNYGSQTCYNPLSLMANASFDILQNSTRNNNLSQLELANGFGNVGWNLSHARQVVNQYGWRNFVRSEILPVTLSRRNAQYWPNYKLHLLGGGMTYIATAEWYELHDCPYPRGLSLATMVVQHYLNEAVENNAYCGPNVDPVADLMIFDPLGIVLFSLPGVPEFFAHKLLMTDWSFQPLYNFNNSQILNNGQKFVFKIPLPWTKRFRIFDLTGTEGLVGLSCQVNATDCLTLSGGYSTNKLLDVDEHTGVRKLTAQLVRAGGIFYDRNNSLLASLILGGPRGYRARLNIYPGVVGTKRVKPGWV